MPPLAAGSYIDEILIIFLSAPAAWLFDCGKSADHGFILPL